MREVIDLLKSRGAALIGFADLSPLDEATRRGFPRAISFCVALNPRIIADIRTGPTEEYCGEYDQVNERLTAMSNETGELLRSLGHRAESRPASHDWDRQTFRAPFSHKMAATLSGLGWVGKCALLITPQFGSAARWATVLTDAPLPTGQALTESQCGECHACVDICPGKACSGIQWKQGLPREAFWDHLACLRGTEIVSAGRLNHFGICGMCIAACPRTQVYLKREGAI
jgi:epoxyqueuosine reductase